MFTIQNKLKLPLVAQIHRNRFTCSWRAGWCRQVISGVDDTWDIGCECASTGWCSSSRTGAHTADKTRLGNGRNTARTQTEIDLHRQSARTIQFSVSLTKLHSNFT